MSTPTSFQFLQPGWLLLLPLLWVVIWAYARHARRKSMWLKVCDAHLLDQMTSGQAAGAGQGSLPWILGSALTLGIIAAAAPSWSKLSYPIMVSSSARVIVLDLSRSMLIEDVRPSRYRHAVVAASEIIGNGFEGETGMVVFAGSAFVLAPLSRDADTLEAFLQAVHPDIMPEDGSSLGLAIASAQNLLAASLSGHGQILLITSGDSSSESPVQAALAAAEQGHRVSILAIGTATGGPLPDQKGGLQRDANGQIVIKRTNYALLQRIAEAGNGSLVITGTELDNSDLITSRLGANQLIESDRNADSSEREAANDGIWLVWLMLPLTLLLFRRNLLWMLLLLVLVPGERELYAGEWEGFWKHPEQIAVEAYQRGDYEIALKMTDDPFLQGSSLYRKGQFEQALAQFERENSPRSSYNRANSLAQLHRFAEALIAYQQALELNPGMTVARYNKRLIEVFLEEQSQLTGAEMEAEDSVDLPANTQGQEDTEMRIGIAAEMQINPAEDPQLGTGLGANRQSGQVDPFERFDGLDHGLDRFVLRALDPDQSPQVEFIERWINSLPETSTDLYRRKFLRDYRRQQQQSR